MLAFAKEARPAGNLSWGTVVEFSVDKVFVRPPSHTVVGFVYPGPCARRVSDRIQGRQFVFRRREGVDAATCTGNRIRPLPPRWSACISVGNPVAARARQSPRERTGQTCFIRFPFRY